MTVERYIPDFSQERHLCYRNAFNTCSLIQDYYRVITRYLKDKNLSSNNDEDVEIFKDLLFESKFRTVHLTYAHWLIDWVKKKNSRLFLLEKYVEYMYNVSTMHVGDFWVILLSEENIVLIELLLKECSSNFRLHLIENAMAHSPKIIKVIPKLKTYMIFS